MSSTYGTLFRVSTWGESHGPALGAVIDGCPAGLTLNADEIQRDLDLRRPGQSKLTTPRNEADQVEILSGLFEGKTTGTPISLMIRNADQRSHDYGDMVNLYRPGHADLAYDLKYGFRDYRGGGRSSARETAARVAAGAIARKLLREACGTEILAYVAQVGDAAIPTSLDPLQVTAAQMEAHPVRCPDEAAARAMADQVEQARAAQDSIGGLVQLVVKNPPVGVGEPVFDRVESELAKAMLSIPASKGFEIGAGFSAVSLRGSQHNDQIGHDGSRFFTHTNRAGGTYGGITIGEPILCRIAFKPTATISQAQPTVGRDGAEALLAAKGRHDPCVALRAPVIVEAMAALVLVDLLLRQRAKSGLFA
jgi:chorismate synthase